MNAFLKIIIFAASVYLTGCDSDINYSDRSSINVTLKRIPGPTMTSASLPHLSHYDQSVLMSWVETSTASDMRYALKFATWKNSRWSQPTTIASGNNWFVNWADFPSVTRHGPEHFVAHWLKKSAPDTYAYDVMISTSVDGSTWTEPLSPHRDGTLTEHGFATFFELQGQSSIVWLDGRHTVNTGTSNDHSQGTMELRTKIIGNNAQSILLDQKTCDCCQTAAVTTENGAVIFYRDRSDDEVRDIAYTRYDAAQHKWQASKRLHEDGWVINGCPVNGPQADSLGNNIAVIWFTGAQDKLQVKLSHSFDGGKSFAEPVIITDSQTIGRVDIALLANDLILASWIKLNANNSASLMISQYDQTLAKHAEYKISDISHERKSGFPRMTRINQNSAMITWTDSSKNQSEPAIQSAIIEIQ